MKADATIGYTWRVALSFDPDAHNPTRKNLFGTWRVRDCFISHHSEPLFWVSWPEANGRKELYLLSPRKLARGQVVNPAKLAIEALRHCMTFKHLIATYPVVEVGDEIIYFGKAMNV